MHPPMKNSDTNKDAPAGCMKRLVRLIFMNKEQLRNDYNILHVALSDSRQLSVAYPILARHGLMERTANGYKSIDPDAVVRRARELIDRIADDVIQGIESNDSRLASADPETPNP